MSPRDVDTPLGPARVTVDDPAGPPVGTLLLGHGAGGGIEAPDLLAATDAAVAGGWRVLRVEQPWRVAGKRVAAAPPRLDEGWTAIHAGIVDLLTGPVVFGGRSAGARVACRTAGPLGASAVLCLAFPLHPPGKPDKSRAHELTGVDVPVLVVQGDSDAFGGPAEVQGALGDHRAQVVAVRGDHALKAVPSAVRSAVATWLAALA
ncbi:alpha/beta hydrolase family protein [Klenkia terrae]|uniref:alpha/beta hydrolase family protein n=1 Tax=Klenkia terrae TaxID=1052259 RepID=UPI001CD84E81|nr:alpha/beta family hydrolase [Klenkia terrae]